MRPTIVALALGLTGCAQQMAEAPPIEPVKPAPVVADTFCATARKRTWAVKDTPESIREADAWNRAIDKRCGEKSG
jgi:hypothetical protein